MILMLLKAMWSISVRMPIIFLYLCVKEWQNGTFKQTRDPHCWSQIQVCSSMADPYLTSPWRRKCRTYTATTKWSNKAYSAQRSQLLLFFLNVLSMQLYPSGDLSLLMSRCYTCQTDIQIFLQFPIIIRDNATSRFKQTAQEKYIFIFK